MSKNKIGYYHIIAHVPFGKDEEFYQRTGKAGFGKKFVTANEASLFYESTFLIEEKRKEGLIKILIDLGVFASSSPVCISER